MLIYESIPTFDKHTGLATGKTEQTYKECRCDYSGELIEGDPDFSSYCAYSLDYEDHDPCMGACDGEVEFSEKYNINMFQFLTSNYHFMSVPGGVYSEDYMETMMMQEALVNVHNQKSIWKGCFTFDSMCRVARTNTAEKLIKDGVIKPENLDGYTGKPK